MALRFFAGNALTGDLLGMELPLHDVTMSGSLEGGTVKARLDLRRLIDPGDWGGAIAIRDALAPGVTTLVAILDEMWAGEGQPRQTHVHREWLIDDAVRDFTDPVIELSGVEWSGYTRHRVLDRRWAYSDFDSVMLVRMLLAECFGPITMDYQGWVSNSGRKISVDWPAGSRTYWDAITDVMGDSFFEWTIRSGPVGSTSMPQRVTRTLVVGEPKLWLARPDITLEAVTPGSPPAGVLSLADRDNLEARTHEVWAFGAGSGVDQIVSRQAVETPPGMVRLSSMVSARDAVTVADAAREARRVLGRMTPAAHTITAVVDGTYLPGEGPQVGHVYQWIKEPSLSIPLRETFRVRVAAYQWTPSEDGKRDRHELTLAREEPA